LSLKCNSGGAIANPKTLILSYPLLRGWGSKIYAEGLFKHPLRGKLLGFNVKGNSSPLQKLYLLGDKELQLTITFVPEMLNVEAPPIFQGE